ncbi:MAG: hypothetical protein QXO51_07080, partial [Halobacteria archaeon]
AAPAASAVKVTLNAGSVTLGGNVTVAVSTSECLTSAAGHSTCTQAILVVDGKVMNKTLTKGASPSITIPTAGSVAVSPECGNATAKGIICITKAGTYKAHVWIVNDTVSDATNGTIATLSSISGDLIGNNPPDASATFTVSLPSFSASLSKNSTVAGEDVVLSGSAEGAATIGAWVFNKGGNLENGVCYYRSLTTSSGAFTWTLDRAITGASGDYTVFVIFPGADGVYSKTDNSAPPFDTASGRCAAALSGDGAQVLSTLQGQVDPLRSDDASRVFKLQVDRPFLRLDPLALAFLNDSVTISGRTNRPEGTVVVSVTRPFFEEQKSATVSGGAFSAVFDTTVSNDSARPWVPGDYTVRAVDDRGREDTMTVQFVERRPAEFQVDNLVVFLEDGTAMDGKPPAIGQKLTASAVLVNRGEKEGTVTLHFQLSGRNLCAPSTVLGPGQSALVNCTFTVNHSGTYTLQADGRSVTLNVAGPKLPEVAGEAKPISSLPGGGQARLLFSGPVDQVVINARSAVSGAQVVVQPLDARPEGTAPPPGTPFRYFAISGVNLPDSAVGTVNVIFRVDGGWLAEKKLNPSTVRLYRLAASPQGVAGWRVEPDTSRLGTDGRTDGSQDIVYQARVTSFGEFAVVGGSTEGAIAVAGEGGPLDILFNIPAMAAIAGGSGFAVFAWRRGWLDRVLRRKKGAAPEEGAPGAALPEGAAEALPRTYEDEVLSLFKSGQMGPAFRRIFDEVAGPLKASLGLEGTFSTGELLREAEAKGLDPMLLTTLGQLFATCDAARFSGIPPSDDHLKWCLRAARSIFARLSGNGAALPASVGGGAVPPGAAPSVGEAGAAAPGDYGPDAPPGPPEGGFEAAGLRPDSDAPPAPEAPEEHKGENGNGSRRRRRRRGGNGGNGNGGGPYPGSGGNGNGNGNGHHRSGNGDGNGDLYSASLPATYRPAGNGYYARNRPTYYASAPPAPAEAPKAERILLAPPGEGLKAYESFQRALFPSFSPPAGPGGSLEVALPVPPLSPRPTPGPKAPGTNGHGANGNGTNGHGTNGHGTNGHGANGNGTNGHGPAPAGPPPVSPGASLRDAPAPRPPASRSRVVALPDVKTPLVKREPAAAPQRAPGRAPIPGIGGRTPTPNRPELNPVPPSERESSGRRNGGGTSGSAGSFHPPPSLSSPPSPEEARRGLPQPKYGHAPRPFPREE